MVLLAGPGVAICDECVALCAEMICVDANGNPLPERDAWREKLIASLVSLRRQPPAASDKPSGDPA